MNEMAVVVVVAAADDDDVAVDSDSSADGIAADIADAAFP